MPTLASENELLLPGKRTYKSIDEQLGDIVLDQSRHGKTWFTVFSIGFLGVNLLLVSILWLLWNGIGVWGNNQPVGWGFDIINFVWWIGIGHAGTLISAILLLLRQGWRNSINRFAEAMTIFAVMCAGMYPLLHTGRPWVAYWLMPYPNVLAMWPQFRSPLVWDVFAVTTYMTVSILFWYVGLIPDLATLRDRATSKPVRVIFGMLALGWNGGAKSWHRYMHASIMLAGLSAPLVLSVHSIVSFDFAMSIVPGWVTTIFPPYFVAGAVFAGFAMVIALAIPIRKWYRLEDFITMKHFDWMAKVMLATGLIVAYGYGMEVFYAWYSGNAFETALLFNRVRFGQTPYSWSFWALMLFNVVIPNALWLPKVRQNLTALFWISMSISIGMWFERYVIIPISLTRDFLPSSFGFYTPTIVDIGMFAGTIGFFIFMMFLFIRFLPMINIFEMKELWHHMKHHDKAHAASEAH
ncbi:MAG: polysulfide reductase NrfD [Armatimonadetes bacterium]|nr:polysulfide reductase NrfD [Armatimonadota bacterium]